MKLLVFSDIHGSLLAARIAMDAFRSRKADYILLLGDILYHGPRNPLPEGYDPAGVAELLAPASGKIMAVRGNCDSDVDSMVLPFPLTGDLMWLLDCGLRVCATHGHVYSPEKPPVLEEGDVLLSGHTHFPTATATPQGIHLCNPGSPALPKDGHPPSYGWLEHGSFSAFTTRGELYLYLDCV